MHATRLWRWVGAFALLALVACESTTVTLDDACAEFCEGSRICAEQDGEDMSEATEQTCVDECMEAGEQEAALSPSEILACAQGPLVACDEYAVILCVHPEDPVSVMISFFQPVCAKMFECCAAESEDKPYETESECAFETFVWMSQSFFDGLGLDYAEIDVDKAKACRVAAASAVASASCDSFQSRTVKSNSENASGCDYLSFVTGLQEEGEICQVPEENVTGMVSTSDRYCVGDLVCDKAGVGDEYLCTRFSALGEDCDGNFDCNSGLVCEPDGTCGEPFAEGEPCKFVLDCASGLFCSPDEICKAPFSDGEPCEYPGDCASSNCDDQICAPNKGLCGNW